MSRSSTNDFSGVTSDGSIPVTSSMISAMPAMISSWVVATVAPSNLLLRPTDVGLWVLLPGEPGIMPGELRQPVQISGGLDGVRRAPPKFALGDFGKGSGGGQLDDLWIG